MGAFALEGQFIGFPELLKCTVEILARKDGKAQARAAKSPKQKDADTLALEKRVSDALGLQVSVDHRAKGGTLHIHYRDLDQLDEVLRRLERP